MTEVNMAQLAQTKAAVTGAPVAGSNFWNPENINKIITGIRELMAEYQKLRGIMPVQPSNGDQRVHDIPQTSDMQRPQQQGISMQQVTAFAKQFCDQLDAQGYGDKRPIDVLNAFPYTIKQIRGMIP